MHRLHKRPEAPCIKEGGRGASGDPLPHSLHYVCRWFLEQALDKVALTAEGGPRRFQGWDSAAVSTSERLRATADRAGRQVNSNVSTTLSVHTTQCITTVGAAGAALPRRARNSFLRFLYSMNSLSVISFVRLSVRSFKGSAPLPAITVVPAVSWSPLALARVFCVSLPSRPG